MWYDLMSSCVSMWCSVKNGILMPCDALCCDMMQCNTMWCRDMMQYSALRYDVTHSVMKCSAFRSEEMWCDAMQCIIAMQGSAMMMSYVICCYAMRSDVIGCNSVHVQHDIWLMLYNVIQCDLLQCSAMQWYTIWCSVVQSTAIRFDVI